MTSETDRAIPAFLAQAGFAGAVRVPLAGDASTRRYERIQARGRRAMLMIAPPSTESPPCPVGATVEQRRQLGWNATSLLAASRVEAFVAVAAYLREIGLAAPEILGVDLAHGLAIVEDLGDDLFAQVIPRGADEVRLYEEAARVLAHVHQAEAPRQLQGAGGAVWPVLDYDGLALQTNADLFVEWLPRAVEVRITEAQRARWEAVRDGLIAAAVTFPRAFTIRDYHAENLLWLPERAGLQKVGLLDFQDALRGWRAWDFTMLLHDARRDVSRPAHEAAVRAYLAASGAAEAPFQHELAVLGALNCMRILGLFARLSARDGKQRYLAFMPRMWGHLARTLAHPGLEDARALVSEVAQPYLEQAA
jgi:hypothetical protein